MKALWINLHITLETNENVEYINDDEDSPEIFLPDGDEGDKDDDDSSIKFMNCVR